MPSAPPSYKPPHSRSARQVDRERGSARARGYDGWWDKARLEHLAEQPLCRFCELDGVVTAADTVDHFWGRGQANAWFRRREWWVSCCSACHSGLKQAAERAGHATLVALSRRLGLSTPTG